MISAILNASLIRHTATLMAVNQDAWLMSYLSTNHASAKMAIFVLMACAKYAHPVTTMTHSAADVSPNVLKTKPMTK